MKEGKENAVMVCVSFGDEDGDRLGCGAQRSMSYMHDFCSSSCYGVMFFFQNPSRPNPTMWIEIRGMSLSVTRSVKSFADKWQCCQAAVHHLLILISKHFLQTPVESVSKLHRFSWWTMLPLRCCCLWSHPLVCSTACPLGSLEKILRLL